MPTHIFRQLSHFSSFEHNCYIRSGRVYHSILSFPTLCESSKEKNFRDLRNISSPLESKSINAISVFTIFVVIHRE